MYTPLSKTRLSSSTCVGCLLAGGVSVGVRSPGSHFSPPEVGISFAEVNGKQRQNKSLETPICLFRQWRSLWFAVWEISSRAALCDTHSTPALQLLCYRAVLICCPPLLFPHGRSTVRWLGLAALYRTTSLQSLVRSLMFAGAAQHLFQSWALQDGSWERSMPGQGLLVESRRWRRFILKDCSLW